MSGKPTVGVLHGFSMAGRHIRRGSRGNGGSDGNDRGSGGTEPEASRRLAGDGIERLKPPRQERCAIA